MTGLTPGPVASWATIDQETLDRHQIRGVDLGVLSKLKTPTSKSGKKIHNGTKESTAELTSI